MAGLPSIDTGYKPEFSLGALYQGMNAANADMSAQEELVRQFLANQREASLQPIDVAQADQNLLASMYKSDPRYQRGMVDMIEGQGMSNLASGQTAKGLQQFTQNEKQAELEKSTLENNLLKMMFGGVTTQYDPTKSDNERIAGAQQATALTGTLAEIDPKFQQQKTLIGLKGDEALEQIDARQRAKDAAAEEKRSDPKYKEQLAIAFRTVADPNATPQQKYEAEMFIHLDRQSRLASNPAAYTQKLDLPATTETGKIVTQPAPIVQEQRPVAPPATTTQQPTQTRPRMSEAERAAHIEAIRKQFQGK